VEGSPTGLERRLLAELCYQLPELRKRAEQQLWSDDLDYLISDLATGRTTVQDAFRRLFVAEDPDVDRLEPPPGIEGAHLAGLAEVTLSGDYRCPSARCARRGHRDDLGRVPVCTLDDKPMVFRSEAP